MVLPALRIDSFLERKRPTVKVVDVESAKNPGVQFELFLRKENIHATAVLLDGEFIVEAGSMARKSWIGTREDKTSYWKIFDELVAEGILIDSGTHRVFQTNYAFSSTSAAGAVVNGRSTAGPLAWKLRGTQRTYREWEAEKLSSVNAE